MRMLCRRSASLTSDDAEVARPSPGASCGRSRPAALPSRRRRSGEILVTPSTSSATSSPKISCSVSFVVSVSSRTSCSSPTAMEVSSSRMSARM